MHWFRMYNEFATDPIIQSLAFEDQRHFVMILCLKSEGVLDRKMSPESRQRIINRALQLDSEGAKNARDRLMEVGIVDKNWQPINWDKRQFISDDSTTRVRKYRKNKETGNGHAPFPQRPCNAPDTDTDTDTEKEKEQKNLEKDLSSFGDNPPEKPVDWLFKTGLHFLLERGVQEKNARSAIGRWRKIYHDQPTVHAITQAMIENATEPIAYITACLRQHEEPDWMKGSVN